VAAPGAAFAPIGAKLAAGSGAKLPAAKPSIPRAARPAKKGGGFDYLLWGLVAGGVLSVALGALLWLRRRSPLPAARPGRERSATREAFDIKRRARGYDRKTVDRLLGRAARFHRDLTAERDSLAERVESLERELARYRSIEGRLTDALITAERVAGDREQQAHRSAEDLVQAAEEERDRLQQEIQQLESMRDELLSSYRAFVLVALELLQEHDPEREQPAEASPLR